MDCQLLLQGIDTLQAAYFLKRADRSAFDFEKLAVEKESLTQSKSKNPAAVILAGGEFLLHPYGSRSGYPFILETPDFKIECGEFNIPNFFVTFRSQALWRESAWLLHKKFLDWAAKLGLVPAREEALSRVDYCFDYHLPQVDFNEDNFVSRSTKDSQYRERGKVQTFCFGKGDIVLRMYDKIAEIQQQSNKVWFYLLWKMQQDVWRIEWQVRKPILKRFAIRTFQDLQDQQGDLLRYLATEHDTLRVPTTDTNRSRWPLHPLWNDLQEQIANLNNLGVHRVIGQPAVMEERMQRMATSIYGYLKRMAAITCIKRHQTMIDHDKTATLLMHYINRIHDPLAWEMDVQKRIKEMELGQW